MSAQQDYPDDYSGMSVHELKHHVRREALRYIFEPSRNVVYFRSRNIDLPGANSIIIGRVFSKLIEENIVEDANPERSNTRTYRFKLDPRQELAYWIAADIGYWATFPRKHKTLHVLDVRKDEPATLCGEENYSNQRGDDTIRPKPASAIPHGFHSACGHCTRVIEQDDLWDVYL